MKKIILLLFMSVITMGMISAQEFGGPMVGPPMGDFSEDSTFVEAQTTNPKEYGRQMADILNERVTLSQEQYVTIYKIYKNEMQTIINSKAMNSASNDPISMMMNGTQSLPASSSDAQSKRVEKRNRKFAKILDSVQFNTYLKMQISGEID